MESTRNETGCLAVFPLKIFTNFKIVAERLNSTVLKYQMDKIGVKYSPEDEIMW